MTSWKDMARNFRSHALTGKEGRVTHQHKKRKKISVSVLRTGK
jgi:hypothetical protein